MEKKPSSLAGPLWVIGIGLLILGMGVGFMAYVLWEKKSEAERRSARPPLTPEEVRALVESNRAKATLPPPRIRASQINPVNTVPANVLPENTNRVPIGLPMDESGRVVTPPLPGVGINTGGGGPVATPAGIISGRVTLRGAPPPETHITISDPNCGKVAPPPKTTRFYVVNPEGGLADVFVHLHVASKPRTYPISNPNPGHTPVIDQLGCIYTPQVIGVQLGQHMIVRNSDLVLHNNHFTPDVPPYASVNNVQLPKPRGGDQTYIWGQPEIFLRLKCDVHPWMFAYIGVMEHPFYAVSDTNGVFQFAAPPPGRYTIEAVHRKTHLKGGGGIQREIEVRAGEPLKLDFEVTLPR